MLEIPPPAELGEFVQALGAEDTLRLIEAYGGTSLWVPHTFDPARPNVAALIVEFDAPMVKAMVQRWGKGPLKVPNIKWWRARLYRARGQEIARIARRLGVDVKTVWKYLSDAGMTKQQAELPL